MNFKKFYESFISPFVSRSQPQNAINTGPDAGTTTSSFNNTFPSKLDSLKVKLPTKKKKKKRKN